MTPIEVEAAIRMLNGRVDRIEQLLPNLATREDLTNLRLATRQGLADLRQGLDGLRLEVGDLRIHMGVLHEDVKSDIRLLAEHMAQVIERLDRMERRT